MPVHQDPGSRILSNRGLSRTTGILALVVAIISLPVEPASSQGFSPGIPSKEYIYSGTRLIATEEEPVSGLPDLIVTDISWSPVSPVGGNAVTFSGTVKNQGNGATPAGIVLTLHFAVAGSLTITWSGSYTASLAPGASVTLVADSGSAGVSTWLATPGTHTVEAWVDDANRITDSIETNNRLTEPFMVANSPPAVNITSPASGTSFIVPANNLFPDIVINASASDPDGTISRVEFFRNGSTLIGTDTTNPYSVTWSNVVMGTYSITAKATDNSGLSTTSAPVTITVFMPNSSAFVSQSVPLSMAGGQNYGVAIIFRNTGTTTWTAGGGYKLGSQNPNGNTNWGLSWVDVPATVAPGGTVTFNFSVKAPATGGNYNFQWGMVQQPSGWFGPSTSNIAVTVTPAPPAFTSFTFTPSSVYPDSCATLSWSTTNATTVSIAGSGTFGPTGSLRVCVGSSPITKVGTATGPGGTATASRTLTIRSCPGGICP